MSDPIYIVYCPDEGYDEFPSLDEARDAFDREADILRDKSTGGWPEDADQLRLFRCEVVAQFTLRTVATAEDDTADGERCRDAGWDYLAKGVVEEHPSEVDTLRARVADLEQHAAHAAEKLRDRDAQIERLSGWLALIEGGDNPSDDAGQLRRWAYEATTLGRPVPWVSP